MTTNRIKRAAVFIIAAAMVLAVLLGPADAAADLVYLCINDTFVQSLTANNMPLRLNNSMYISYRYLSRIKTVKFFYDDDADTLRVYNSASQIIFDLKNAVTYDQDGKIYSYLAVRRGGVLYIPIEFVCRIFGVYYSQINSTNGMVIRINSVMSRLSDSEVITSNRELMRKIYNNYYNPQVDPEPDPPEEPSEEPPAAQTRPENTTPPAVAPTQTPDPETDEPPEERPVEKTVYTAIIGGVNGYTSSMADTLGTLGIKATFFVSEEGLEENGDTLRKLVCHGHGLGLYVSASDPVHQAERLNELLFGLASRTSRLVMISEGSTVLTADDRAALSAAGYRIWDAALDPGSRTRGAATVGQNAANLLNTAPRLSVMGIYSTDAGAEALGTVLGNMRRAGVTAAEINEWTTPINAARYYN